MRHPHSKRLHLHNTRDSHAWPPLLPPHRSAAASAAHPAASTTCALCAASIGALRARTLEPPSRAVRALTAFLHVFRARSAFDSVPSLPHQHASSTGPVVKGAAPGIRGSVAFSGTVASCAPVPRPANPPLCTQITHCICIRVCVTVRTILWIFPLQRGASSGGQCAPGCAPPLPPPPLSPLLPPAPPLSCLQTPCRRHT